MNRVKQKLERRQIQLLGSEDTVLAGNDLEIEANVKLRCVRYTKHGKHISAGEVPEVEVFECGSTEECAKSDVVPTKRRKGRNSQKRSDSDLKRNGLIMEDARREGIMDQDILRKTIDETLEIFVKTKNYEHAKTMLENKGHVTITGKQGEGKTTLALFLGREYQVKGHQMIFVEDTSKIQMRDYALLDGQKFVFIFDNVFANTINGDIPKLRSVLKDIKSFFKEESTSREGKRLVYYIFTTSSSDLQTGLARVKCQSMDFFKRINVLDMTESGTSTKDKAEIFRKHKVQYHRMNVDFRDLKEDSVCRAGFPLSCKLFFHFPWLQAQNIKADDFFKDPIAIVNKELTRVLRLKNEQSTLLVLMVLCNGRLDLSQIGTETMKPTLKTVIELTPGVSATDITKAAERLRGSLFMITAGNSIRFVNPVVFDECSKAMFEVKPRYVLENCSMQFLHQRVRTSHQNSSEQSLRVSTEHEHLFAFRIAQSIVVGDFNYSITHPSLGSNSVMENVFTFLENWDHNTNIKDVDRGMGKRRPSVTEMLGFRKNWKETFLNSEDSLKDFLYWTVASLTLNLTQKVITFGCRLSDIDVGNLFVLAASCGNLDVLELFKDKPGIKQYVIYEALESSVQNNEAEAFRYLLQFCKNLVKCAPKTNLLQLARQNSTTMEQDILNVICQQKNIPKSIQGANSILHFACKNGDVQLAKFVVPVADVNNTLGGLTPVMAAALYGNKDIFDLLRNQGARLDILFNKNSLLHLACEGGNVHIVESLMDDISVNVRGQEKLTPIMKTALAGWGKVFDLLRANGANLMLTDEFGNNVLHCASSGDSMYIVERLLETFKVDVQGHCGLTALMRAVYKGRKDVCDLLISKEADVNITDQSDANALHWACCGGNLDIVKCLLPSFDIDTKGGNGFTPIMYAASHGRRHIFDFLKSKGADLRKTDVSGNTLLHLASCGKNVKIVEQLLPLFDVNLKGQDGFSPLMNAACYGSQDVFQLLVDRGADVNASNDHENTVLHCACVGGIVGIVQTLLAKYDVDCKGRNRMTPLMVAARYGNVDVFQVLISKGANLSLCDKDGINVLDHAYAGKNESVIERLSWTAL